MCDYVTMLYYVAKKTTIKPTLKNNPIRSETTSFK